MKNELQVKVTKFTPAEVSFNSEEIKSAAKEIAKKYEGLVFTDETVKDAKKVAAEINKIKKSVDDFKKKAKKELTPAVKALETECKEVIAILDEPYQHIKSQLEIFEDNRIKAKSEEIQVYIDNAYSDYQVEESRQKLEWPKDWLNATKQMKDIASEVNHLVNAISLEQREHYSNVEKVETFVELINVKLALNVPLSKETFVSMLSHGTVEEIKLQAEKRGQERKESEEAYAEKVKREAEAEANKKIEAVQAKAKEEVETMTEVVAKELMPVEAEGKVHGFTFKIKATVNQKDALKLFMDRNGIKYEAVK